MPTQMNLAAYMYIHIHNLFFHPRQVTEPESEISEAGTALMFLWIFDSMGPINRRHQVVALHIFWGFTRFAKNSEKKQGLVWKSK